MHGDTNASIGVDVLASIKKKKARLTPQTVTHKVPRSVDPQM